MFQKILSVINRARDCNYAFEKILYLKSLLFYGDMMFIIFSFKRVVDILKERVVNVLPGCISGMADELLKLH